MSSTFLGRDSGNLQRSNLDDVALGIFVNRRVQLEVGDEKLFRLAGLLDRVVQEDGDDLLVGEEVHNGRVVVVADDPGIGLPVDEVRQSLVLLQKVVVAI